MMARKKILWLCSWYPNKMEPFNGDFIQRHACAAALYNDIYVVHVAADETGSTGSTEQIIRTADGLTEHIIYFKKPASFLGKIQSGLTWLSLSKRAIREYIHQQGKPDLIHVHIPVKAGIAALWALRKYKIPYLVTEHWTIYHPESPVKYEEQSILFKIILRRIISHCRLITPVSRNLGMLINQKVVSKEFSVIENVANENYFYHIEPKDISKIFRFIHVSNMTYQKNVQEIIHCFSELQKRIKKIELVLIGVVPKNIDQLIKSTGLLNKQIFVRGEINYTKVAEELQQANSLVMFSRFENSPCSIIEALCSGLPVISTNVGGIPELLNVSNGILVDAENRETLIIAMEKMVKDYSQYNHKKIAELATNKFSYPVIGKKIDEVYQAVLKG